MKRTLRCGSSSWPSLGACCCWPSSRTACGSAASSSGRDQRIPRSVAIWRKWVAVQRQLVVQLSPYWVQRAARMFSNKRAPSAGIWCDALHRERSATGSGNCCPTTTTNSNNIPSHIVDVTTTKTTTITIDSIRTMRRMMGISMCAP